MFKKEILYVFIAITVLAGSAFVLSMKIDNLDSCAGDKCAGESGQPVCGDKFCGEGETEANCMYDCGVKYKLCGDGNCDLEENVTNCPQDCPANYCEIACEEQGQAAVSDCSDKRVMQRFNTTVAGTCCCVDKSDEEITEDCLGEGEGMFSLDSTNKKCCVGLFPTLENNSYYRCTKCGNGACDAGETAENCAVDCGATAGCVREGGTIDTSGTKFCCAGLTALSGCEDANCMADSWTCANCGNGECGMGENKYNCAKDCAAQSSCGNGKCEPGEGSGCPRDCGIRTINIIDKPVIYLYPQKIKAVNVQLDYTGKLIAEYPNYDPVSGWNVTAYPDGRLINRADGREYSYLFWEGSGYGNDYDMTKGFVVKGSDTKQFLQEILAKIGLAPKEYNEFIVYWYPKMKDNPYNIIHFAAEEYTSKAKLEITPEPDSLLRVFMVFKPSQTAVAIEPQMFAPFERKGFTVVEWGGSELE